MTIQNTVNGLGGSVMSEECRDELTIEMNKQTQLMQSTYDAINMAKNKEENQN